VTPFGVRALLENQDNNKPGGWCSVRRMCPGRPSSRFNCGPNRSTTRKPYYSVAEPRSHAPPEQLLVCDGSVLCLHDTIDIRRALGHAPAPFDLRGAVIHW